MNFPIGTSLAVHVLVFCAPVLAEIKTETISVSIRDGVRLATVVYRDDAVKQAPVVLIRKPPQTGGV